jgi:hypothetical protein
MSRRARAHVPRGPWRPPGVGLLAVGLLSCGSPTGLGPEALQPQYYDLAYTDRGGLPQQYLWDYSLISARLVPYGLGRTIDQRLVNDRGGRGSTGGNTRDTTVMRGQMMDLRTLVLLLEDGRTVAVSDSVIVDVEVVDTTMIIRRPHPDPARTQVDTGFFANGLLVMPTVISLERFGGGGSIRRTFFYRVHR